MEITLNGNKERLDKVLTIRELLQYKKYSFPNIIVRVNGQFIKKSEYEERTVSQGDVVQMIHMISGG